MKWDQSWKNDDGTRTRKAFFQDEKQAHTLTDNNGKRLVLICEGGTPDHPGGTVLAETTPCSRMEKTTSGKYYRPWLVMIKTPGHKYGFVTVPSKDRAIEMMLNPDERKFYQGRPMGLRT